MKKVISNRIPKARGISRARNAAVSAAVLVLALALAGTFEPPARAGGSLNDKIDAQRKKLEKIKNEMKEHKQKSRELEKEQKSLLAKISSLEKEESLAKKLVSESLKQEGLFEEKIDSLSIRISIEGEKLLFQQDRLRLRLRQLYMRDPNFTWAALLGCESLQSMYRKHKFLELIAKRDAALLKEVAGRKMLLETEKAELTEVLVDVSEVRKMREEEKGNLQHAKKQRLAVLKKIRTEKSKHKQALNELSRSQQKIMDLIGSLEDKRTEKEKLGGGRITDFASLRGKLMRPVKGKVIKRFGKSKHPAYGTVTFNSGIDIKASTGTPIRSVAEGTVEFVDWIAGYGRCIIVNHGRGYYTLYAHVSDVFVESGRDVSKGEVIAEVGDTGSIEGSVCHFEIRKSKKALDPARWFAK